MLLPCTLLAIAAFDSTADTRSPLARAGDLDGDGVPDVWVAHRARLARPAGDLDPPGDPIPRGQVFALSGRDGSVLMHLTGGPKLVRSFGRALAPAGDIDGDGIGDLLVAAGRTDSEVGAVEVRSGRDGMLLLCIAGEREGDFFGFCIAGGEDFDGDRVPDVLVAAPGESLAWSHGRGEPRSYVFSGRTGKPLPLFEDSAGERSHCSRGTGMSVGALPDIDGDSWPDIALGGSVRSGRDGSVLFDMEPGNWASGALGDVDGDGLTDLFLSHVDEEVTVRSGRDGTVVHRWSYQGGYLHAEGGTVSAVGDADGDGVPDLAIGANEPGIDCDRGWAKLFSGATGEMLWSRNAERVSGYEVEGIGDADGDARGDVVLLRYTTRIVELVSGRTGETRWSVALPELLE